MLASFKMNHKIFLFVPKEYAKSPVRSVSFVQNECRVRRHEKEFVTSLPRTCARFPIKRNSDLWRVNGCEIGCCTWDEVFGQSETPVRKTTCGAIIRGRSISTHCRRYGCRFIIGRHRLSASSRIFCY